VYNKDGKVDTKWQKEVFDRIANNDGHLNAFGADEQQTIDQDQAIFDRPPPVPTKAERRRQFKEDHPNDPMPEDMLERRRLDTSTDLDALKGYTKGMSRKQLEALLSTLEAGGDQLSVLPADPLLVELGLQTEAVQQTPQKAKPSKTADDDDGSHSNLITNPVSDLDPYTTYRHKGGLWIYSQVLGFIFQLHPVLMSRIRTQQVGATYEMHKHTNAHTYKRTNIQNTQRQNSMRVH
jgi:hypothetical protein